MDGQASTISTAINRPASYRWLQLFMGIVCMAMIANLQYGWTLFVNPISEKYGWTRAAIQVAFTIFVLTETWLVPFEGYLVDKYGPRPVVLVGGLLCRRGQPDEPDALQTGAKLTYVYETFDLLAVRFHSNHRHPRTRWPARRSRRQPARGLFERWAGGRRMACSDRKSVV